MTGDGSLLLAHGIGGRQDLPIPFSYAVAGAAVALVVSFVLLGALWKEPRLDGEKAGRPLPRWLADAVDSRALHVGLAALGLAFTAYVALAGLAGRDDALNPTAGVVFVLLWVGIVPASLIFGPVYRLLNPLRTLHAGLCALLRLDPREGILAMPRGLGYWPGAVALFAFTWLELAAPDRATLPVLRLWFAAYAVVQLFAALVFGSQWFERGDGFEVYAELVARLSPWGRRGDGVLVVRNPLAGLDTVPVAPGVVAVVAVLLGSTAFDGLSNVPPWVQAVQASDVPQTLTETLGLLGSVLVFGFAFVLACLAAGRLGDAPRTAVPARFAHSVVPIALGYAIAHYYSLLVLEGQRTVIHLSDPLGTGANWLGTADRGVSPALVGATLVATLQVVAVVVGHVLGVIAAHDRAVSLFPRRSAVAGQLPLLVLMVCYTVAGLLLLFAG